MTSKRIIAMAAAITFMGAAAGCSGPKEKESLHILVGTYTENRASEGIYLYSFDPQTAGSAFLDTAVSGNPSFVVLSEDRQFAYAINEFSDERQGVTALRIEGDSIDVLNFRQGKCDGPCNAVIACGNLITSDYGGGTLSVFPILPDGSLDTMSFQFVPENRSDSTVARIHCSTVSPEGKYLFTTDLGNDYIYRSTLRGDGVPPCDFCTAYGFDASAHPGPRHLIFSADGRFAYLISEKGDCVSVFSYSDGILRHISTTLAYDAEGHGSADIHISPDGEYLYTSHRLVGDGIAIFKRNQEDGTITRAGFCPTGKHPRNFAITPDGRYLLCACRDDNRIEIYAVDKANGALNFTGKCIEVPAPVCIQIF